MANTIKDSKAGKALALAEKLLAYGLSGRKDSGVIARAKKSNDYFNTEHRISAAPERNGRRVYNKFGEIYENKIAYYTSSRPKWKFSAQEEGDLFVAKALNQILGDVVFDRIKWNIKGEDANIEAANAGSTHIKPGIDIDTGYPTFSVFPCESVMPDPGADTVNQLQFFVWLTVKTPAEILRDYNIAVTAKPAMLIDEDDTNAERTFRNPLKGIFKSSSSSVENVWLLLDKSEHKSTKDKLNRMTVAEIWIEDLTREQIPFTQEEVDEEHALLARNQAPLNPTADDNNPKHIEAHNEFLANLDSEEDSELIALFNDHISKHQQMPQSKSRYKYPDGRFITVTGGKLLRDEHNPFGIHWRELVVKFDYMKVRNRYWGKPLGQDLYGPQDDLNHRKNMITQNINLLQNGIKKVKKGLYKGTALKFLDNMIGRIVEVNHENDFTVDYGKPLPSDHWRDVQHIETFMDRQAGNTDVLAGRLPAPGTAGTTVDQLVQQSGVRFSLPLRHYAAALEQMGRISITLMSQFLFDDEVFEIMGQDNQIKPTQWQQLKDRFKNLDGSIKDIRIDISSLTSTTREKDEQVALQRLQLNAYDVQAYLEKIDDPAKYQILERMSKINQLNQVVQQQQQENEQLKKALNTAANRQQGEGGAGNVGNV